MKFIKQYLNQANEVEIQGGMTWYQRAHGIAVELSSKYNIDIKIVCSVISALSPRAVWESNIRDAENLFRCHCNGRKYHNVKVTTYGRNKQKAIDLLKETINPDTCFVAPKTLNFYQNIFNPENKDYITIDGHSINIFYGKLGAVENKHFTKKGYNKIAKAYRIIAEKCGIMPNQLQAITWLTFKRINNIKVNWRYYQQNLPF